MGVWIRKKRMMAQRVALNGWCIYMIGIDDKDRIARARFCSGMHFGVIVEKEYNNKIRAADCESFLLSMYQGQLAK